MVNKVVARFVDGRTLKGSVFDVSPSSPIVHLQGDDGVPRPVRMADLKALFFVKDHVGDPERADRQEFDPADPRQRGARPVQIRFRDGETLAAFCPRYPPTGTFFFVVPADPASNNDRILVNGKAIERMTVVRPSA